jgi:hypothetical protein
LAGNEIMHLNRQLVINRPPELLWIIIFHPVHQDLSEKRFPIRPVCFLIKKNEILSAEKSTCNQIKNQFIYNNR